MRFLLFLFSVGFFACSQSKEEPISPHLPSKNYHYTEIDFSALERKELVYVPVYSDIYHMDGTRRFLLTATVSVRNTSPRDSIFINNVRYFDSQGELQRTYIERTIYLAPLQSVEFVVEHTEDKGGAGANFLVNWGGKMKISSPVMQAVMIGTTSQQGISFLTEGVVIERDTILLAN